MCSRIGFRSIALTINSELMFIEGGRFEVNFCESIENPTVRLETDGMTILAAIDAEVTLEEAVRSGRLSSAMGKSGRSWRISRSPFVLRLRRDQKSLIPHAVGEIPLGSSATEFKRPF